MESIEELPPIDERLALPEAGYEIIDGVVTFVAPADEPHAEAHEVIARLVGAYAHADFKVAIDMLTRTSKIDDIAPDVSVYPRARDAVTGGRQLEHLAFEVVSTTSLTYAGTKAAKLIGRGVRRVFAIDVERKRVLEWSHGLSSWGALDPRGTIADPALAVPLPVNALVTATNIDEEVSQALLVKGTRTLEASRARAREEGREAGREEGREEGRAAGRAAGREEGRAAGREEGRAEAMMAILTSRGFRLTDAQRERILAERDPARLDDWLARVAICATVDELIGS